MSSIICRVFHLKNRELGQDGISWLLRNRKRVLEAQSGVRLSTIHLGRDEMFLHAFADVRSIKNRSIISQNTVSQILFQSGLWFVAHHFPVSEVIVALELPPIARGDGTFLSRYTNLAIMTHKS